jgi:hypothetical protein
MLDGLRQGFVSPGMELPSNHRAAWPARDLHG